MIHLRGVDRTAAIYAGEFRESRPRDISITLSRRAETDALDRRDGGHLTGVIRAVFKNFFDVLALDVYRLTSDSPGRIRWGEDTDGTAIYYDFILHLSDVSITLSAARDDDRQ